MCSDGPGHKHMEVTDLLAFVSPAYGGDSPVMDAYRKRNIAAGAACSRPCVRPDFISRRAMALSGDLSAEEARETVASSPVPIDRTADQQIADTDDASDRTFERTPASPTDRRRCET